MANIKYMKYLTKKNIILGTITSLVLATAIITASSTLAAGKGNPGSAGNLGFRGKSNAVRQELPNLTDAQKAELKLKNEAVIAALQAGDYNAWVAAVKAINPNSPLLSKITASNFSKYVEVYKLQIQIDALNQELGIGRGTWGMFGEGRGFIKN